MGQWQHVKEPWSVGALPARTNWDYAMTRPFEMQLHLLLGPYTLYLQQFSVLFRWQMIFESQLQGETSPFSPPHPKGGHCKGYYKTFHGQKRIRTFRNAAVKTEHWLFAKSLAMSFYIMGLITSEHCGSGTLCFSVFASTFNVIVCKLFICYQNSDL